MPFPTTSDPMSGDVEITIGSTLINSNFVGTITPSVSPVIRTSDRISGTSSRPSGRLDNPSFVATIYLNDWSDMQYIMADYMDGDSFVLGSTECSIPDPVLVNFHYSCDDDEARDINLPVAYVAFEDTNERNANDELAVSIYFYPQVNPLGQVVYGPLGS